MAESSEQKREFPSKCGLKARHLLFRLLDSDCTGGVCQFCSRLPDEDLLFLERDITQQHVMTEWIEEAVQGRLVTVLA